MDIIGNYNLYVQYFSFENKYIIKLILCIFQKQYLCVLFILVQFTLPICIPKSLLRLILMYLWFKFKFLFLNNSFFICFKLITVYLTWLSFSIFYKVMQHYCCFNYTIYRILTSNYNTFINSPPRDHNAKSVFNATLCSAQSKMFVFNFIKKLTWYILYLNLLIYITYS